MSIKKRLFSLRKQKVIKRSKKFLSAYKDFAMRGNVIDLAVGVIIGGAFGKITTSMVNDLFMPLLGKIAGSLDFSNWFIAMDGQSYALRSDVPEGISIFAYGSFLTTVLDFLIIAFFVFLLVRVINRLKAKEEGAPKPEPPKEKECPYCRTSIPIAAIRCPHCTSELE